MPMSDSASKTPRKVPPRSKQSNSTGVIFSAASGLRPGTNDGSHEDAGEDGENGRQRNPPSDACNPQPWHLVSLQTSDFPGFFPGEPAIECLSFLAQRVDRRGRDDPFDASRQFRVQG